MIIKILGLIIGVAVLISGVVLFVKEKSDKESQKIYGITAVIGLIVAVVCAVLLFV